MIPDTHGRAHGHAALEVLEVEAAYGPFRALFGISLRVEPGEAVALLGPNGAGKTTVARVATGLVAPAVGRVLVGGHDLTGKPTYRFTRAGVAHAPEGRSVFATLTVEENLLLCFRRSLGRRRARAGLDVAYEMFPQLGRRRDQLAGTMSGGEQRMVSMSRVIVEAPEVLVADELSLGLAPVVVDEVYATLAELRRRGTSLLIIEQHVGHALDLCDRVVLLNHGTATWHGPAADAVHHVATELFAPAS